MQFVAVLSVRCVFITKIFTSPSFWIYTLVFTTRRSPLNFSCQRIWCNQLCWRHYSSFCLWVPLWSSSSPDPPAVRLRSQSQLVFSSLSVQSQIPSDTANWVKWKKKKKKKKNMSMMVFDKAIINACWFVPLQHSLHRDPSCHRPTGSPVLTGNCCRIQLSRRRPAACLQTGMSGFCNELPPTSRGAIW